MSLTIALMAHPRLRPTVTYASRLVRYASLTPSSLMAQAAVGRRIEHSNLVKVRSDGERANSDSPPPAEFGCNPTVSVSTSRSPLDPL
eukprot:9454018-Pyramimonas_sp.AAC.1